ncbi:MAG: FKBP-type peptidyl-prolyl cis-trans isomerase [Anaerolineae bacterium]|jgi:peptidylprolyl isomerase
MRLNVTLLAALLLLAGLLGACNGDAGNTNATENGQAVGNAVGDSGQAEDAAAADTGGQDEPGDEASEDMAGDDDAAGDGETAQVDLGEGAVVTDSGLQILELTAGEGPVAERCDTLAVHYTGTLASGVQFDGSISRGAPFMFTLGAGEVISGWDEGLEGASAGTRRTLAIPPELGYGSADKGNIPPNSQLLFDVEVVGVAKRPELPNGPNLVEAYEEDENGLQYAVLEEGDGDVATSGDAVMVHYAGWLEDGTLFDSSLNPDRCEPLTFGLGQGMVIPGWDAGVTGMKVGERRQLVIPPELAYGPEGYGPIPPDSTLVFEVELVGIR